MKSWFFFSKAKKKSQIFGENRTFMCEAITESNYNNSNVDSFIGWWMINFYHIETLKTRFIIMLRPSTSKTVKFNTKFDHVSLFEKKKITFFLYATNVIFLELNEVVILNGNFISRTFLISVNILFHRHGSIFWSLYFSAKWHDLSIVIIKSEPNCNCEKEKNPSENVIDMWHLISTDVSQTK